MSYPNLMPDERIEFVPLSQKTQFRQKRLRALLKTALIVVLSCVVTVALIRVAEAASFFG